MDLLGHVRTESARFAEVLRQVDPAARVPSCPDWSAADLLWHLTEVHATWATVVRDRLTDPGAAEAAVVARPADRDAALALFDRTTDDLLTALGSTPDDVAVWTWAPDRTVGFVRRFQAHEALIHRLDAELAAGAVTALPTKLADDGIGVVLTAVMTWHPEGARTTHLDAVGSIEATDTGSRRVVRLGGWSGRSPWTGTDVVDQPLVTVLDGTAADEATPTFTVRGPAADVDTWIWGRRGATAPVLDGDAAHLTRFRRQVARGVP